MKSILLAAAAQPDRSFAFTATVVIAGIGIVLATLAVLIVIFNVFGKAVHFSQEKARTKQRQKLMQQMAQEPIVPEPVKVSSAELPLPPAAVQGVTPEVVAAISAAVYMLDGQQAKITPIQRKTGFDMARGAWAQAAVLDNTRPF